MIGMLVSRLENGIYTSMERVMQYHYFNEYKNYNFAITLVRTVYFKLCLYYYKAVLYYGIETGKLAGMNGMIS